MDLNYIYKRYGISIQMAEDASCSCSRIVHRKLAEGYAVQIAEARVYGTPETIL